MPPRRLARLAATLSADERRRLAPMLPHVARRAAASRGLLREHLAAQLGVAPADVPLRQAPGGRPVLDRQPLRFSVAHAGGLALFAFAPAHALGVDVERVRALPRRDALAAAVLTEEERDELASLPLAARDRALLEAWTRKEAYLKARGDGLALSPRAVVVSLLPGAPPALLAVAGAAGEPARWALHRLAPAPGHVATLAVAA